MCRQQLERPEIDLDNNSKRERERQNRIKNEENYHDLEVKGSTGQCLSPSTRLSGTAAPTVSVLVW
jgi:hypothetical protein